MVAVLPLLAACSGTGTRGDLSAARQEIVMNALAQVGTPYRYGGSSPDEGFDCSGLVHYTHLAAGVSVPRATGDQKKASRKVRGSRRQAGDLVFFRIGRSYHVGIVVDGGRFVHAPRSGKQVQLSSIDNPYWRERLSATATFLN